MGDYGTRDWGIGDGEAVERRTEGRSGELLSGELLVVFSEKKDDIVSGR